MEKMSFYFLWQAMPSWLHRAFISIASSFRSGLKRVFFHVTMQPFFFFFNIEEFFLGIVWELICSKRSAVVLWPSVTSSIGLSRGACSPPATGERHLLCLNAQVFTQFCYRLLPSFIQAQQPPAKAFAPLSCQVLLYEFLPLIFWAPTSLGK